MESCVRYRSEKGRYGTNRRQQTVDTRQNRLHHTLPPASTERRSMAYSADPMPTTEEDVTRKTVILPLCLHTTTAAEKRRRRWHTLRTASLDSRAGPLLRVRCIVQVGAQNKDKDKTRTETRAFIIPSWWDSWDSWELDRGPRDDGGWMKGCCFLCPRPAFRNMRQRGPLTTGTV